MTILFHNGLDTDEGGDSRGAVSSSGPVSSGGVDLNSDTYVPLTPQGSHLPVIVEENSDDFLDVREEDETEDVLEDAPLRVLETSDFSPPATHTPVYSPPIPYAPKASETVPVEMPTVAPQLLPIIFQPNAPVAAQPEVIHIAPPPGLSLPSPPVPKPSYKPLLQPKVFPTPFPIAFPSQSSLPYRYPPGKFIHVSEPHPQFSVPQFIPDMFQIETPHLPMSSRMIDDRQFVNPKAVIGRPPDTDFRTVLGRIMEYARGRDRDERIHVPRRPSTHDSRDRAELAERRRRDHEMARQPKRERSREPLVTTGPKKVREQSSKSSQPLAIENVPEPSTTVVPPAVPLSTNQTQGT